MTTLNTQLEDGGMSFTDNYGNQVAFATPTGGLIPSFTLLFDASDLLPEGMPHQISHVSMKVCEWLALAAQQHLEDTGH